MSTNYPNDYDSYPTWQDLVDIIAAAIINNIQDAIVAIEHELGKNPSGDYATVKERLDSIPAGGRWQLIEEVELTSRQDSYTFSGLDGDTDKEYLLVVRIVGADYGGWKRLGVRFNGDAATHYDERQGARSYSSSCYCSRGWQSLGTFARLPGGNMLCMAEMHIWAKSGYPRTMISHCNVVQVSDQTIICAGTFFSDWTNTTDNITSITVCSDQSNQLGAGSVLQLWKRT